MGHQGQRAWRIIVASAVTAILVMAAACGTSQGTTASSPSSADGGTASQDSSSPSSSGTTASQDAASPSDTAGTDTSSSSSASADAGELNEQYDSAHATERLRSSLLSQGTGFTAVTMLEPEKARELHDTSHSEYTAGTYVLTVKCLGSGALEVDWEMGDDDAGGTDREGTVTCSPQIATEQYTIQLQGSVTGMSVELDPEDDTAAQMAYRVDRKDEGKS